MKAAEYTIRLIRVEEEISGVVSSVEDTKVKIERALKEKDVERAEFFVDTMKTLTKELKELEEFKVWLKAKI